MFQTWVDKSKKNVAGFGIQVEENWNKHADFKWKKKYDKIFPHRDLEI